MTVEVSIHYRPDLEWSDVAAELAADELIAGKLITEDQFDFAKRIIAQQLSILLMTGLRPTSENSN